MLIMIHTKHKGSKLQENLHFYYNPKGNFFIYYFSNLLQILPPTCPKASILHDPCNNLPTVSDLAHCALIIVLFLLALNKEHEPSLVFPAV